MRMIFDTAAAISGVRPGATLARVSSVVRADSSQLRKSPIARFVRLNGILKLR